MAYTQTGGHLEEHNYSEIRNSIYDATDAQYVATLPQRGTGTTNHKRRTRIMFVLIGLIIGGVISGVVYGTLRTGFTWSSWSPCSATCGNGKQYRVNKQDGDYFEEKLCSKKPCPEMNKTRGLSSGITSSSWSPCSVTCGGGKQYRVNKQDSDHFEEKLCSKKSCPEVNKTRGLSSDITWSSWSPCSVTCGGGKQYRVKQLDIDHFETKACKITSCPDCKTDEFGLTYSGTINTTITGRTCQAWNVMQPHRHNYKMAETDSNYCRNQNHIKYYPGPWCFTTDPNYIRDYCPVYKCGTECSTGFFLCNDGKCILDYWRCNGKADCNGAEDEIGCDNVPECLQDEKGLTYRGKVSVTLSGKSCQYWSSQWPHTHDYTIGTKNYCRNTELTADKPWCYTTDANKRWEYCNIPLCG